MIKASPISDIRYDFGKCGSKKRCYDTTIPDDLIWKDPTCNPPAILSARVQKWNQESYTHVAIIIVSEPPEYSCDGKGMHLLRSVSNAQIAVFLDAANTIRCANDFDTSNRNRGRTALCNKPSNWHTDLDSFRNTLTHEVIHIVAYHYGTIHVVDVPDYMAEDGTIRSVTLGYTKSPTVVRRCKGTFGAIMLTSERYCVEIATGHFCFATRSWPSPVV